MSIAHFLSVPQLNGQLDHFHNFYYEKEIQGYTVVHCIHDSFSKDTFWDAESLSFSGFLDRLRVFLAVIINISIAIPRSVLNPYRLLLPYSLGKSER